MSKPSQFKIGIIGAGAVGITLACVLEVSGTVRKMVLIDKNREKLKGDVLDLNHGLFFVPPVEIVQGDYSDLKDAFLIVITAGAKQKPGQSRLELLKENVSILKEIVLKIKKVNKNAILLIVSNPVDVLTYYAARFYGNKKKVIGSGTVLDSARFRYFLSKHCQVDARSVHAYVIGEHGDSEVLLWSKVNISGVEFEEFCRGCRKKCTPSQRQNLKNKITDAVRNSAYHIIEYKGATNFGVAFALRRIIEAIMRDENSVLTVSTMLEGEYGLKDVALSVPSLVNARGVVRRLEMKISSSELKKLKESAKILKKAIKQVEK